MKELNIDVIERYQLQPYAGPHSITPHLGDCENRKERKLYANLKQAIEASELKDGMTVSFHHSFRGGDKTVNMVMDLLAEMGFKNLTLASSSLSEVHAPLVEHIKNGVVTKIYTSGLRGELAEEISRGLMEEPIQIHSHGGRVYLVESGEIDIAFSPQQATISALLTHVRRGDIVNVYSLRRGAAEAIEAIAHGDENTSKVIGREIGEIKLPPGTTIGAIVREEQVIIAHSDTVIQANDHVILFLVDKKFISDVEKLFQPSAIFF